MRALGLVLDGFLLANVQEALARDPNASIRLMLMGPPQEALEELFNLLTANGQSEWSCPSGGGIVSIPVLFVNYNGNPSIPRGVVSSWCWWDYAVTVRNSSDRLLILVAPDAADRIPESLANTTEMFGGLMGKASRRWLDTVLWKYLVRQISTRLGLSPEQAGFALRKIAKQSSSLVPAVRDRILWETVDVLLQGPRGLSGLDALALASGLPAIGSSGGSLEDAAKVLEKLAKLIGRQGIAGVMDSIKNTQVIQSKALVQTVEELYGHLIGSAPSGASFQEAPMVYYRPVATPTPAWWSLLDQSIIFAALDELAPPSSGRLTVTCENSLTNVDDVAVVASSIDLKAAAPGGTVLPGADFARRIGRGAVTALAPNATDAWRSADISPPVHDRPIAYQATAPGFNDGMLRAIALDSFSCRGLVLVSNADDNPVPTHAKRQRAWSQQIVLPRSGNSDIRILHCSGIASVEINRQDSAEGPWTPAPHNAHETSIVLDIEDGSRYTVRLFDPGGAEMASWSIEFIVHEVGEAPPTRFEMLVKAHQRKGKRIAPARVIDSPIRRVEEAYLRSSDSWRPVLACWPSEELGSLQLDWTDPKLGSHFPQLDPRPALTPPPALLEAREAVRDHLSATRRPLGEVEFDETALKPLVEAYLKQYGQWLAGGTLGVTWFDSICVHVAAANDQVGGFLAYPEPSVILLSPLHPLRLGWQCCAQQTLAEALSYPCPAAGLLDPSGCPDIGLWVLRQGSDSPMPRAFLSAACEDPHWSVLLNRVYVGQAPVDLALARLAELGLRTMGLPGGFSRSQAYDSVEEVAKLLSGRATLRIGLVGGSEESSACAKGVETWCSLNCDEEQRGAVSPYTVEVFDMRRRSAEPTAEQLEILAEETSERVRWFRVPQLPLDSPQDLVLLDQLGSDAPGGDGGASRTATSPAALVRVRTREDSRNAMQLKESRVGRPEPMAAGLLTTVAELCIAFENLAIRDAGTSHFTFRPVQQAIGSRLSQAIYVAVTSTQIDPACIIRGARSQHGYLWNYELPGVLSGDEDRAGYYLIATPTDAMLRAISQSAQLVAATPPPVRELLDEISRRGIPILKRLAAGGSQSRGELGLLLAIRYLQDAFRLGAARVGLPVWHGRCIHLILAVDPYESTFEEIRRALRLQASEQRPDLLVFAIRLPSRDDEKICIKITPVEVKFRQGQMPGTDIRDALAQATNLGALLSKLWAEPLPSILWTVCSCALLGQMLELAFRLYADSAVHGKPAEKWTYLQERVISAVLNRNAEIILNAKGRLLVFDQSPQSTALDADADLRFDTSVVCRHDASSLLTGSGALSAQAEQSIGLLDFSFPDCSDAVDDGAVPARDSLSTAQLSPTSAAGATPATVTPQQITSDAPQSTVVQEAQGSAGSDAEVVAATSGTSLVPPEIRQAVRLAFEGFIGNEAAVRRIQNDLLRALIDRPPHLSKNFLFTGQPSTGKTEISRRMASALRLPFVRLDGRGLRSRERLFELIDGELGQRGLSPAQVSTQVGLPVYEYPALVVFIDEIHLVPRPIQESLLTMLEAADRSATLADRVALMNRTTFLFATTRASDVDSAFRSRCSEVQLKEYSREQVAAMVRLRYPHPWPESVYLAIAQLGRRVPRIALELCRELETAITVAEDPTRPVQQHLDDVRRARELDELGLTLNDLEYLSHLARENRPIGEQTILNILGAVDRDRVVDEIEPFLRSLGFIRFGPRGREITEEGKNYLMDRTRHGVSL